jgi:hypothetical protein
VSAVRVTVTRDTSVLPGKRWLVRYCGHLYPFPSHARAIEAASDPAHLCRYTCICPVAKHRGAA